MSKPNGSLITTPENNDEQGFVDGVIQGLRDFDEGREITLAEVKERLKHNPRRKATHSANGLVYE